MTVDADFIFQLSEILHLSGIIAIDWRTFLLAFFFPYGNMHIDPIWLDNEID